MQLVPGKALSEIILNDLENKILQNNYSPKLAIIQIGAEEASNIYVQRKLEASSRIGIETNVLKFNSEEDRAIKDSVLRLNQDNSVNGIIIQLPTPGAEIFPVLELINPEKDVDGLTSNNLGKSWYNRSVIKLGATPKAILFTLQHIAKNQSSTLEQFLISKTVLVVNHNILIGKPLAGALTNFNSTVILANEHTKNLNGLISQADIIVSATGKHILGESNSEFLTDGVIIIDSGFARVEGRSEGDVDQNAVSQKASWLTPVPGGIGPLGVAMLMQNTYDAYLSQNSLRP